MGKKEQSETSVLDINGKIVELDKSKLRGWNRAKNNALPRLVVSPTLFCAVVTYIILTTMFLVFGYSWIVRANEVKEVRIRYDDHC
jgi:hypothetical protein